jgi:hypothetical protein
MSEQDKLTDEDMKRVKKYLNSGFNVTERKPFRGLVLLGIIWSVVAVLGGVSWYIGQQAGFL